MTEQICEKLTYNGKEYDIHNEPLYPYLIRNYPTNLFGPNNNTMQTDCGRGYVGEWIIENDKLYLVKLEVVPFDCDECDGMSRLFPGQEKVFAEWFSGLIAIDDDDLVEFHSNVGKRFHPMVFLNFTDGCLVGKKETGLYE